MSQRYNTTTEIPSTSTTVAGLTPARLVLGCFAFAGGTQIAILLTGGLLLTAWTGDLPGSTWKELLLISSLPWLLASLFLLRMTWRYLVAVLELVTGQDLDRSGLIGDLTSGVEQIRLIPVKGSERLIDSLPEEDLLAFIDGLSVRGISGRGWIGQKLPSGKVVDWQYLDSLCQILQKAGLLKDRGPRKSGYLVTKDPEEIKQALRLQ